MSWITFTSVRRRPQSCIFAFIISYIWVYILRSLSFWNVLLNYIRSWFRYYSQRRFEYEVVHWHVKGTYTTNVGNSKIDLTFNSFWFLILPQNFHESCENSKYIYINYGEMNCIRWYEGIHIRKTVSLALKTVFILKTAQLIKCLFCSCMQIIWKVQCPSKKRVKKNPASCSCGPEQPFFLAWTSIDPLPFSQVVAQHYL